MKTKKAILRLEQGVHSYIQRALASRGAFAVFYGRRLKHYIKKTEVLKENISLKSSLLGVILYIVLNINEVGLMKEVIL